MPSPTILSRLLAVLALMAACAASPADAGGLIQELRLGILDQDTPDLWSGFRAEPDSATVNVELILAPAVPFAGGLIRPAVGASINTAGGTSDVYLDARYQVDLTSSIFLGLGVGAALHDGQLTLEDWDRKALGSRVLFHIPIEIGLRLDEHDSLSAYFEHMSNADTVDPNEGLDRIGVRYGYRF